MNTKPNITGSMRVRALADGQTAELLIYGDIGDSPFGSSVAALDVVVQLAALAPNVTTIRVRLNSYGGSATDGMAIYNALAQHPARKIVLIDGVAASIASLIAMAGDEVRMPPSSLMMIHAPWSPGSSGNAVELRDLADQLDAFANAMAQAYARKSGQSLDAILALLADGADHWYSAEEAVAAGFADTVIGEADAMDAQEPIEQAAFARGLDRFIPRAPARIAAALRALTVNQESPDMPNPNTPASPEALAASRESVLAAERARREAIRMHAHPYRNREDGNFLARVDYENALDDPAVTAEAFGLRILSELGRDCQPLAGIPRGIDYPAAPAPNRGSHARDSGTPIDFVQAASDALAMRAGIRIANPHPASRDLRAMSVVSIARACLSRAGRSNTHLEPAAAIQAALTTSDFPGILQNTMGKSLRVGFATEPASHTLWVKPSTVADFKQQSRVILGSAPDLVQVLEGGEYEEGALDEDKAVFSVSKYGRLIYLSFEALVNDDLGAFANVPRGLGQAARRREADVIYNDLLLANSGAGQTMQDSVTLFHASHNNLATSADSLDADALGAARALLRKQTAVGGGILNLSPKYLLVGADLEQQAEILIASSARAMNQGSNQALVPGWVAGLTLVVEPRLPSSAFYVVADAMQIDTCELAYLAGEDGPVLIERDGFEVDRHEYKLRHVFGARFLDWRGIVKTPIGS
jgi:ATP-dependent protease ClpP protease subunit